MSDPIVACWDSDFIPFYVLHNKKDQPEKTLEEAFVLCDDMIHNINNAINADYYVGFLTKGKCFRYDISSSYKANRKYDNMPKYLQEVREYMISKHGFTYKEGYEADDCVISFKAQNNQFKTIIVSPDKDILNLEGKHYNPRLNEFKKTSKQEADVFFWKSMLVGDSVDNIKGVPGIGKVGASQIIKYNEQEENGNFIPFFNIILSYYIEYYGEYEGIKQYYQNYFMLKLVDDVQLDGLILNKIDK